MNAEPVVLEGSAEDAVGVSMFSWRLRIVIRVFGGMVIRGRRIG